jgi:hypothetical protein
MNDVEKFCEKYLKDVNYTINPDDTIDVNGEVDLNERLGDMEKLPVKFGKVSGDFSCGNNNLTTLEGCPKYVGGDFLCGQNKLTTLEHCPNYVGERFGCSINNLTTLKGIEKCEIKENFRCMRNNNIPPEKYIYILTAKISGKVEIGNEEIDNILNTYKNEVKYLHKALSELKKVKL